MEKYHSRFDCSVKENKFPNLQIEIDREYDDNYTVTKTFFFRVHYEKFMLDGSDGNRWFLAKSGHVGESFFNQ